MRGQYGSAEDARPSGTGCAEHDEDRSARLFLCGRCRQQVLICSCCDRGQIYCVDGCADAARRQSLREAGRRYQRSRDGRFAPLTKMGWGPRWPVHSKPNGEIDRHPWCRGFYAAMRLRISAWALLLGPAKKSRETRQFLHNAHNDIPAVVEAMRHYSMPARDARAS